MRSSPVQDTTVGKLSLLGFDPQNSSHKPNRTIEDTQVAICTISVVATNLISHEKVDQVTNEQNLVRRAQRGDEDAFSALFQLYRRLVYSVCLSMTRDAAEAEDMTQEAFLKVFEKVGTLRRDSAFSSWLYRVAVNTVLMKRRRHKSPPMLSLDAPALSDSPSLRQELGKRDPSLSGAIDRISLHRAIQALPAGCRKIFRLYEVHGYQHREIAELLHCSIGNSKSQLRHAKLKMRDLLFPQWASTRSRNVICITDER
jgi:RNA polymerase sigma-70 factor (ECF subfamily)